MIRAPNHKLVITGHSCRPLSTHDECLTFGPATERLRTRALSDETQLYGLAGLSPSVFIALNHGNGHATQAFAPL